MRRVVLVFLLPSLAHAMACEVGGFSKRLKATLASNRTANTDPRPQKLGIYDRRTRRYSEVEDEPYSAKIGRAENDYRVAKAAGKKADGLRARQSIGDNLRLRAALNLKQGNIGAAIGDLKEAAKQFDVVAQGRVYGKGDATVPRKTWQAIDANVKAGNIKKAADYVAPEKLIEYADELRVTGLIDTSKPSFTKRLQSDPVVALDAYRQNYETQRLRVELLKRARSIAPQNVESALYSAERALENIAQQMDATVALIR